MPGATETEFFERAGMMDTKVGTAKKDDAGDVAKIGFQAMLKGDGDVVTGWQNTLRTAIASIAPLAHELVWLVPDEQDERSRRENGTHP